MRRAEAVIAATACPGEAGALQRPLLTWPTRAAGPGLCFQRNDLARLATACPPGGPVECEASCVKRNRRDRCERRIVLLKVQHRELKILELGNAGRVCTSTAPSNALQCGHGNRVDRGLERGALFVAMLCIRARSPHERCGHNARVTCPERWRASLTG